MAARAACGCGQLIAAYFGERGPRVPVPLAGGAVVMSCFITVPFMWQRSFLHW